MQETESQNIQENNQESENTENFAILYQNMQEQIKEVNATIKFLKVNMKELGKLHKQDINRVGKTKKVRKNNVSGINKPKEVPKPIIELLDLDEDILLARTEVTKKIYEYIKANDLQDQNDKRTIIPNDKLKELFSLEDTE
jgi:chromatin remodeling complex protein RSC6